MLHSKEKTFKIRVSITIEPDGDRFYAYCSALKGLHVDGDTEEEALGHANDAVIAYLRSLIKHGDPIPIGLIANEETACSPDKPHHHISDLALTLTTA